MKRISILLVALGLLLVGCKEDQVKENKDGFTIGIVQYMDHKALDDSRLGFIEELDKLGLAYNVDYKNAQGDMATARSISEKFVSDGVDLIYAIATPAAQGAQGATEEIPIIFAAVTDPVGAGLVVSEEEPGGNISGVSDRADVRGQLSLYKDLDPSIKTLGLVYSLDEINSKVQVDEVDQVAKDLGIEVKTKGIMTISDLGPSASSLIKEVDGFYILSDNKIASSIGLLSDLLLENKMISICAEESQVQGGGLLTRGMKYKSLGQQAGRMAEQILVDKVKPANLPVEFPQEAQMIVNENTLKALGLSKDLEIFKDAEYIGD
ncbi:MAG: ABC transporter substrate-binding protein [Bacillota bacterium]|nr:ABC transporter substrate-binding protein [Bacillota bacterium]